MQANHDEVGSSGGSAVAVSANIVPLTLGTETDGSIAGPAQINSVVGFKPTPGLTSRDAVIPTSATIDTVGPLARSVADAVVGLEIIMGADKRDPLTLDPKVHRESNYTQFLSKRDVLEGAKFGLPIKGCWEWVSEDQRDAALKIFKGLKEAGAEIIEVDYPSADDRIASNGKWDWYAIFRSRSSIPQAHKNRELGEPSRSEFTVIKVEAYNGINAYLSELSNTDIKSFEDILEFNRENTGTEGARPGDHPAFATGQVSSDLGGCRGIEVLTKPGYL